MVMLSLILILSISDFMLYSDEYIKKDCFNVNMVLFNLITICHSFGIKNSTWPLKLDLYVHN